MNPSVCQLNQNINNGTKNQWWAKQQGLMKEIMRLKPQRAQWWLFFQAWWCSRWTSNPNNYLLKSQVNSRMENITITRTDARNALYSHRTRDGQKVTRMHQVRGKNATVHVGPNRPIRHLIDGRSRNFPSKADHWWKIEARLN